nr:MAG TPA: endonuclease [Caudoviricetes sp.]
MKYTFYKGQKFRIYPTDNQIQFIHQNEGNARFVWNTLLAYLIESYEKDKNFKFPTKNELTRMIPSLKGKHEFLKYSESSSLQFVAETLHDTFVRFFNKKAGFPKFKRKSYSGSFTMKENHNNIRKESNHFFKIPKINGLLKSQRIKLDGKIKKATISFTPSGKYYMTVLVECESQTLPKTGDKIGIDIGLIDFAVLSNGIKEKMPKFHNQYKHKRLMWERKCARRRTLAKQRLGDNWRNSKNYQKARQMVAKYREKEANQRRDFLQKLSTYLVRSYDVIAIEDIKSSNLMKNLKLAESIMRSSWRMFREMLAYKCERYGKELIIVNPKDTTRICSACGVNGGKKELSIREWQCQACYTLHDRDINAAKNILSKGLVLTQ